MALPATEAFTDTNGVALTTHSASWTYNVGTWTINTNAVFPATASSEHGAHWNADTFSNDQYGQIVVAAIDTSQSFAIGPAVRAAVSAVTYYGFYADNSGTPAKYLFKQVTSTWTQIATESGAIAVSDLMRLEANGTALTAKVNGVTRFGGAQTDSAIASGSAGIAGYANAAGHTGERLDTWEGGNLVVTVALIATGRAVAQPMMVLPIARDLAATGRVQAAGDYVLLPTPEGAMPHIITSVYR